MEDDIMTHQADIDIDMANRDDILNLIKHVPARKLHNGKPERHNSGIYVQPIPYDPMVHCSALHFKDADERGYFKLDFLNVSVYQHIKDNDHYNKLLAMDPPWERLAEPAFVNQIIHIANYSAKVAAMMPDTIPRMAMFLSILRPGKQHLINKPWKEIAETVWEKDSDSEGYAFKKAHAVSYSILVTLHMNIINEQEKR
jgi:hypothetical protein